MTTAIEALLAYQQADDDGVMVMTSRQAIHEVADQISSLRNVLEMVWDANQSDPHIPEPALAAIRAALDGVNTPDTIAVYPQAPREVEDRWRESVPRTAGGSLD